jgi:hypothetical protein
MIILKRILKFTLVAITLTSCAWSDESSHQSITKDYEIGWNDLESNRAITKKKQNSDIYSDIIIGSYVFAVGNNDDFIIAKQRQNFDSEAVFYIIDINKNQVDKSKGIYGPLNEKDFLRKKIKLNIQNLIFHLNFSEKPFN